MALQKFQLVLVFGAAILVLLAVIGVVSLQISSSFGDNKNFTTITQKTTTDTEQDPLPGETTDVYTGGYSIGPTTPPKADAAFVNELLHVSDAPAGTYSYDVSFDVKEETIPGGVSNGMRDYDYSTILVNENKKISVIKTTLGKGFEPIPTNPTTGIESLFWTMFAYSSIPHDFFRFGEYSVECTHASTGVLCAEKMDGIEPTMASVVPIPAYNGASPLTSLAFKQGGLLNISGNECHVYSAEPSEGTTYELCFDSKTHAVVRFVQTLESAEMGTQILTMKLTAFDPTPQSASSWYGSPIAMIHSVCDSEKASADVTFMPFISGTTEVAISIAPIISFGFSKIHEFPKTYALKANTSFTDTFEITDGSAYTMQMNLIKVCIDDECVTSNLCAQNWQSTFTNPTPNPPVEQSEKCDTRFGPFAVSQSHISAAESDFVLVNQTGQTVTFTNVLINGTANGKSYSDEVPLSVIMSSNETKTIIVSHDSLFEGIGTSPYDLTYTFTYNAGQLNGNTATGKCIGNVEVALPD